MEDPLLQRISMILLLFVAGCLQSAEGTASQPSLAAEGCVTIEFGGASGTPLIYTEDGLQVTSLYPSSPHLHMNGVTLHNHADCCSTPYRFSMADGSAFSVASVQVVSLSSSHYFQSSEGAAVTLSSVNNGTTFNFTDPGWFDINWFEWDAGGNGYIDNLVICPETPDSALPPCEQATGTIRGRSCDEILDEANRLSRTAVAGRTSRFDREDYLVFFDAVQCRTGVPAPYLRAYAFDESLGIYYADSYPRQYIEPCDQAYNDNGRQGYPELWSRYYGLDSCPIDLNTPQCQERQASEGWPLLATDADPVFSQTTAPGTAPEPGIGINTCDYFERVWNSEEERWECSGTTYTCHRPDAPRGGRNEWAALWRAIPHVALGDDRPYGRQSFGLGLTQMTFGISDLTKLDRIVFVRQEPNYGQGEEGIYPVGGGPAGFNWPSMRKQTGNDIVKVIHDPQYNVLVAAQLAATKWSQVLGRPVNGNDGSITECIDPDYGRILTMHAAPQVWGTNTRNNWICAIGFLKANSDATCENLDGAGHEVIKAAVEHVMDDYIAADAACYTESANPRSGATAGSCRRALRHAFAFGCKDFEQYRQGVFPSGDECRDLIQEYGTP